MEKLIKILVIFGIIILNEYIVSAQAPEQDCFNAIYVCSNNYVQSNSYSGFGSIQEVTAANSCLQYGETNSVWYLFHVINSGLLTFQLTPINPADDYDFVLYNMSHDSCAGIEAGTNHPVRCNYSSTPGATGLANGYILTTVPSN